MEKTRRQAFWISWGDPALDDAYGTWCFGDIELKNARTLAQTLLPPGLAHPFGTDDVGRDISPASSSERVSRPVLPRQSPSAQP